MFNPLSVGAGLVLGRKAYREDMDNRMLRVRNEAKNNVKRFVDDIRSPSARNPATGSRTSTASCATNTAVSPTR